MRERGEEQAGNVRLPRLHAHLRKKPSRTFSAAPSDLSQEEASEVGGAHRGAETATAYVRRRPAQMVERCRTWACAVLRRADELTGAQLLSSLAQGSLAPLVTTTEPTRILDERTENALRPKLRAAGDSHLSPLARLSPCSPVDLSVGARCGKSARRDLFGGRSERAVPTETYRPSDLLPRGLGRRDPPSHQPRPPTARPRALALSPRTLPVATSVEAPQTETSLVETRPVRGQEIESRCRRSNARSTTCRQPVRFAAERRTESR